jgi:hypothetical protein
VVFIAFYFPRGYVLMMPGQCRTSAIVARHNDIGLTVLLWFPAISGRSGGGGPGLGGGRPVRVQDDLHQDDDADLVVVVRVTMWEMTSPGMTWWTTASSGGWLAVCRARVGGQAPRASGFNRLAGLPRARGWPSQAAHAPLRRPRG